MLERLGERFLQVNEQVQSRSVSDPAWPPALTALLLKKRPGAGFHCRRQALGLVLASYELSRQATNIAA